MPAKGTRMSAEGRERIRQALLGHTVSEETREKIRAAKQGIPNSPDANEKVRAAMLALPPEERRRRARLGGLAVSGRPRAKRRKKEEADGG